MKANFVADYKGGLKLLRAKPKGELVSCTNCGNERHTVCTCKRKGGK